MRDTDDKQFTAGLEAQNNISSAPSFEESASIFSRLSLEWYTKILRIGVRTKLQLKDLGRPHPLDDSTTSFMRMQSLWDAEVHQRGLQNASLGRVLFRFVGIRTWMLLTVCAYITVFSLTMQPVANKRLLQWLEGSVSLGTEERWLLVVLMFMLPLVGSFVGAHTAMKASRTGLHLYASLTQMIYHKSLRLSSYARNSASTGRLVNLMSNDAGTTMEQATRTLQPMLTAFPQLVVVLVMLFNELGVAMLSGFGFALFSVPLAVLIFIKIAGLYGLAAHEADARLKVTNDLLTGIRVVKAYAWEKAFIQMVSQIRRRELRFIRRHAYWSMLGMMCVYMQLPAFMQLTVYAVFVAINGTFSAARIFTAIQLFQLLQQPLSQLPSALSQLAQLLSAISRLSAFFRLHELEIHSDDTRSDGELAEGVLAVEVTTDAVFTWEPEDVESWRLILPQSKAEKAAEKKSKKQESATAGGVQSDTATAQSEQEGKEADVPRHPQQPNHDGVAPQSFKLRGVGLRIKQGELIAIVGPVGSGKSSLLSAILNEMAKHSGRVVLQGCIAFASQQAWIQNATLRDNILFGQPYDAEWYEKVVAACALTNDIAVLQHGDLTEIGERGINLSGGQKARVNLARAVYYQAASVLLLDDPLAAVDMHVGDTLFNRCVCGILKGKTILLVTNQLHRLQHVDRIVVLQKGFITEIGSYAELMQANGNFAELMERQGIGAAGDAESLVAAQVSAVAADVSAPASSPTNEGSASVADVRTTRNSATARLTEEEGKLSGYVDWRVYTWYIKKCGMGLVTAVVVFSILQTYLPVSGTYVLAMWTDDVEENGADKDRSFRWLSIYALINCSCLLAACCSGICSAEARVVAARCTHTELMQTMSRAPIAFFDVTPIGRILNRFSKDQLNIDNSVMMMLTWSLVVFFMLLSSCTAVIVATRGWLLILLVPCLIVYSRVFRFVRLSAIEIQRLESTTRSPLASTFQEVLVGLSTIRAYKQQARFQELNTVMMNQNIVPNFLSKSAQPAWLTIRLNCVGALTTGCCALYAVVSDSLSVRQDAGLAGMALSYSSSISQMMMFSIFLMITVETMMNSVERVKEYIDSVMPEEADTVQSKGLSCDELWPNSGRVVLQKLVTGYRDGPNVLHGISADFAPCEKIGVVGRTGSGKSTIILSVFRLIEPRSGTIMIDGIDVTTLSLQQLRSKIGLIPQDPVLFTGSVRYNLDPFSEATYQELWDALDVVRMKDAVSCLANKLDHEVQEGGDNFSVGERQLFCITRALLRNPRILCLDEATASVDSDTDAMLQDMIRKLFAQKTVLTVAHRLDTIMDSDRVMVLDAGHIAQLGAPLALLEDEDGIFSGLVKAGNEEHLRAIATFGYLNAMQPRVTEEVVM